MQLSFVGSQLCASNIAAHTNKDDKKHINQVATKYGYRYVAWLIFTPSS